MKFMTSRFIYVAASALVLSVPTLDAEETAGERHTMAKSHLQRVAADMTASGKLERPNLRIDVESAELSRLHAELIAFGWIEQNAGNSPGIRAGVVL